MRVEWVASSHALYLRTWVSSILLLLRTPRLPVVDWTEALADVNEGTDFVFRGQTKPDFCTCSNTFQTQSTYYQIKFMLEVSSILHWGRGERGGDLRAVFKQVAAGRTLPTSTRCFSTVAESALNFVMSVMNTILTKSRFSGLACGRCRIKYTARDRLTTISDINFVTEIGCTRPGTNIFPESSCTRPETIILKVISALTGLSSSRMPPRQQLKMGYDSFLPQPLQFIND